MHIFLSLHSQGHLTKSIVSGAITYDVLGTDAFPLVSEASFDILNFRTMGSQQASHMRILGREELWRASEAEKLFALTIPLRIITLSTYLRLPSSAAAGASPDGYHLS